MPTPEKELLHRVFWQSRRHFDLAAPWEHVEFGVHATFDVVARPGWRFIAGRQVFHELWLVRAGAVEIEQNGRTFLAQAPAVALIRGGQSRDTRQVGEAPLSIAGFSFSATVWGALDFLSQLDLPPIHVSPSPLEAILERMVKEAQERESGYALAVHGLGQLALVELLRGGEIHPRFEGLSGRNRELQGAVELVSARFEEPLSVGQMARAAHLSPKYFGRKFHAAFGLTPMEYLRRVRLNRARDLLAAGDGSVAQVAGQCGFGDAAHFSRAFKRHFGVSPLSMRREAAREMRPETMKMRPESQNRARGES